MTTYYQHDFPSAAPHASSLFVVRGRFDTGKFRNAFPHITLANGDDVAIAKIPNNSIILAGWYKVVTANGGAATFDLDTTVGGSTFLSNGNANSAGNWTAMTAPVFNSSYETTQDDYLYLQMDTAFTAAVIDVILICILNNDALV